MKDYTGRFMISSKVLFENPVLMKKIFSIIIPYYMVYSPNSDVIRCYGYSKEFEIVSEGSIPPLYEILINEVDNDYKIEIRKSKYQPDWI